MSLESKGEADEQNVKDVFTANITPSDATSSTATSSGSTTGAKDTAEASSNANGIDLTELIPAIEKKGVSTLLPTETLGLKTIRHTLTGLLEGSEEDLSPLLQDKNVESGNYVDFLELSDKIPEDKKHEFDELLEKYNEARQQSVESRGFEGAREKWKKLFEKRVAIQNKAKTGGQQTVTFKALDTLLWEWNKDMLPLIKAEFDRIQKVLKYSTLSQIPADIKKENSASSQNVSYADRFEYGPYLTLVKPENLGPITMLELLKLNSTGGVQEGMRTARAVLAVGKTVEMEYRMQVAKQREKEALKGVDHNQSALASVRTAVKNSDLGTVQTSWPLHIRAKIGSLLISLLLQVAKVAVYGKDPITGEKVSGKAPAFYHSYQYHNGSRVGVLKVHKSVAKHLSGEAMATAIQPQLLPMLVKPRPWTAWNKGGYLYSSAKVMRSRDSPEQVAYLKAASDRGTLDQVYEGLNVLGNTAWTINKDIFEVILKVWNTGEEFLEIPRRVEIQPELPPAPPRDADPSVRRDWLRQCRLIVNENQALYSQRCDTNYKLEIARAFLGERFYLPHNLDFRGRAYPLSPHLNHLGNDLSRGLLKFWEARELGEHGLNWLKVHCANVFGHNKFSFEDRIAFADENMEKILDSANSPMEGQKWWQEAESPWQALATCIEIRNAMNLEDPSKYKCRLPVHMDGSCNGLQHYAALGGDVEGAAEVNLVPSSKPQDVYSRVLEIVRVRVEEDATKGHKEAKMAVDKLSRKLIKQTVMTHVYGVTFVGARQQISNRLSDAGLEQEHLYSTAGYLAKTVLGAVRSLFEGAHLIQDWLGDNATRISRSVRLDMGSMATKSSKNGNRPEFMSSVIWTTPLGLPIVQPYRQDTKKQVITSLQSVFITDPYALRGVNGRKQRTAFPPNFIHSLDASHMLMSAIGCGREGISFAAVHDSYWTHPGDIDKMNRILRDCFIELHQVDLVDKLRIEFEQRYTGLLQYAEIPKDCDIAQKIIRAQAKYSIEKYGTEKKLTVADQIEMENKRLEALEAGLEDIETPVSIIESLSEQELDTLLNQIPKKVKRKRQVKNANFRSTEHVGTGADNFEQLEKQAQEAEVEEADENIDSLTTGRSSTLMGILVPLRITKVPAKGDFDVHQLRDSKYFFS
ncbi:Rpo41p [Sugiyamaella lignohabitans]|uniref:DNA-directed RNA polymerase n=1 Tax=Sugiyamaella lignohabitans TaxID=796027 RepID=A0A167E4J0_9ASCO|nr:Rpo41p [Sugiyamaella lignohabitans]ANB13629.1 Rpo41p [Sugiyamaella lignohabitans]